MFLKSLPSLQSGFRLTLSFNIVITESFSCALMKVAISPDIYFTFGGKFYHPIPFPTMRDPPHIDMFLVKVLHELWLTESN